MTLIYTIETLTAAGLLQVAILCHHQKSVGKGHDGAVEKLQEKLKDAKHQLKDLNASGGCDKSALPPRKPRCLIINRTAVATHDLDAALA